MRLAHKPLLGSDMTKRDFTQTAFDIFQQATGEAEKPKPLTGKKADSSKGGKIGGAKRAENMTKEELSEQAKKAADARWSNTTPHPAKRNKQKELNEAETENIVRNLFRKLGYYDNKDISVQEKKADSAQVSKLLQNASKRGSGKGYPDFIITTKTENDFVCVIECKADVAKHVSETGTKHADYAVDGARLYADYLSKEMDVLYIGVSGQTEDELLVNHFIKLKDDKQPIEVFKPNMLYGFDSYIEQYKKARYRVDYDNLIKYTKTLNEELHKMKIPENNRAILFSGILIALEDDTFYKTYSAYIDPSRLSDFLVQSITQKLNAANINKTRVHEMQQAYNFIKSHTALIDEGRLITLVKAIHEEVRPFIKSNNYFDIISRCYVEFLKYANNDSGLGIVLTPPHIAQLFCDIAGVGMNSIVYDNCCGTAGFLIAAMQKMIDDAKGDLAAIDLIKKKQLVGVEYQDHIFTLGVSNMIIHGDGKTNIIKGDCFKKVDEVKNHKPTVGLLNPPYNDSTGIDELIFIENNLSVIVPNGIVVAIVPMRCALYQKGDGLAIKQRILEKHTLEAVMSMPNELFYPVSAITCIMVFKAHVPHKTSNKKTWFGYWKDDGFTKVKNIGRTDAHQIWESVKARWLETYRSREVHAGESVMQMVTAADEWCAEAYMETDYSKISQADFEEVVKNYAIFKLMQS